MIASELAGAAYTKEELSSTGVYIFINADSGNSYVGSTTNSFFVDSIGISTRDKFYLVLAGKRKSHKGWTLANEADYNEQEGVS